MQASLVPWACAGQPGWRLGTAACCGTTSDIASQRLPELPCLLHSSASLTANGMLQWNAATAFSLPHSALKCRCAFAIVQLQVQIPTRLPLPLKAQEQA